MSVYKFLFALFGMRALAAKLRAGAILLMHRAEFQSKKPPPAPTDSLVFINYRPTSFQRNYKRAGYQQGRGDNYNQNAQNNIKNSFQNSGPALKRRGAQLHNRNSGHGADTHIGRKSIKQIRRILEHNLILIAKSDRAQGLVLVSAWIGKDYFVQIKTFQLCHRIIVKMNKLRDNREADFFMLFQKVNNLFRGRAMVADDGHAPRANSRLIQSSFNQTHRNPTRANIKNRESPAHYRQKTRIKYFLAKHNIKRHGRETGSAGKNKLLQIG